MLGLLKEIYKKSPNNVGVSFINKKAPVRRLFVPEAFHLLFEKYPVKIESTFII